MLLRYFLFLLGAVGLLSAQCQLTVDLDSDGRAEHITLRASRPENPDQGALRLESPAFSRPIVIDDKLTTRECYWLEILGRRGVMVIPFGMQLRFYEAPAKLNGAWRPRDIYSFYTASWQGGLLQVDVDGDGLLDLICGNYWVKSPASFDLPWRLYAINAYHEHPLSASAQLFWDSTRLLWVESRRPQGRVVWFRPPADPRQLWIEEPHPDHQRFDCPQLRVVDGRPLISADTRRCR